MLTLTEIEDRMNFIQVYNNFNKYIQDELGFKPVNTSTTSDYHYSHYDTIIDSLQSVECYSNDILQLTIRFLRDKNEHKFMIVGNSGFHSNIFTLNEFKEFLKHEVIKARDSKIADLEKFNHLQLT